MTSVSGTSSASSAAYAATISSAMPASGSMNMQSLQAWFGVQQSKMWDSVGEATKGVDDRNKVQAQLGDWKRAADQDGGVVLPAEIRAYAETLPEGPLKEAVLKIAEGHATPEDIAAKEKELAAATVALAATEQYVQGTLGPMAQKVNSPAYDKAKELETTLRGELDRMKGADPTIGQAFDRKALSAACEGISKDLEKENSLAMNQLQAIMAAAQQAQSLASNLVKAVNDSASSVIRNMV